MQPLDYIKVNFSELLGHTLFNPIWEGGRVIYDKMAAYFGLVRVNEKFASS